MFIPRVVLFCLLLPMGLPAQEPVLDRLLEEAAPRWTERTVNVAERAAAQLQLAEARSAFRPVVEFGGTYTLAAGGRTIDFPVGDLLNPVYGTLNQLTASGQFPTIANTREQLLPNNFYDLRLRAQLPLLDPEARAAPARAALAVEAAELAEEVTVADWQLAVRTAYYQSLQALAAIEILNGAGELLDEALRTTRSLIRNDAALPLARERLLAEEAQLRAEHATADARLANALAQLEYLLVRPVFREDVVGWQLERSAAPGPPASAPASGDRAELRQLRTAAALTASDRALEARFRRPRLALQVDAGSQAFDFAVNPYVLAGLNLRVPLYDGGRHGLRQQRLEAEAAATELRLLGAQRRILLQQTVATNELAAARARLAAYAPALAAAERTLNDVTLLYRNGSTGYLELVDARQQLTRLRLERNLARYDTWIRYAALLRAVGEGGVSSQ